jgi:hypothetical protein
MRDRARARGCRPGVEFGGRTPRCHRQRIRDVAQPGSALAWGARGREFKSRRPDHLLIPGIRWRGSHRFESIFSLRCAAPGIALLTERAGDWENV